MINSTSKLLVRGGAPWRRLYSDWGAMAEAFGGPSQSQPIRRNQSSVNTTKTAAVPSPAPNEDNSATLTSSESGKDTPAPKMFGSKSLNDFPSASLSQQESTHINWSESFHGLGTTSFDDKIQQILAEPLSSDDIEITPDGLLYLPEIKYRRVLNKSFGAGGWGLAPRSETTLNKNGMAGTLTREYALICQGRLVGIARGEQDYFSEKGIPTASEGCKSNALMRCCKDLGIASELWDPKFIRSFKKKYCEEVFVEHVVNKRKKKIWKRKDGFVEYPFKKT